MHSAPRFRRLLLRTLAVLAIMACLAWTGYAWLGAVAVMFVLGRSYGGRSPAQLAPNGATYGVGAALAGFMPENRG